MSSGQPTNIIVLRLAGDIDAAAVGLLQSAVSSALMQFPDRIHLDLGDVSMLDLSGIEGLRRAETRCGAHNVRFSVINVPDWIDRVFEMVATVRAFERN